MGRVPPVTAGRCPFFIRGQFQIARQIDLDAVTLANGDGRESIEKAIHHLRRRLRRRVPKPTGDHHGAIAGALPESDGAQC